MSVPILYAGSLYRPQPFVPIPTPASTAPHFVSAEIGNVDNSTVVVTFDRDVQADENDYLFGVAITFNGIPTGMIAGFRQANHAVVRYSLVAGASSTDVLTWAYSGAGFIVSEADSTPLANVTAQPVTNNVAPDLGVALRADAVAYWKMDEASGTRIDATLRGNDAIEHGAISSDTGKIGNCSVFSYTVTRYLSAASNADLQMSNTDFTIAGWFRFGAGTVLPRPFVSKIDFNVGTTEYKISYNPQYGEFTFTCAGDTVGGDTLLDPVAGTWYFIVVQYNNSTQDPAISINGDVFTDYGPLGPVLTTSSDLNFGGDVLVGGVLSIDGADDEVGVWRRLLSDGEIAYLYNSGAGRALFP